MPVPHESLGGYDDEPLVVIVVGVDANDDNVVFVYAVLDDAPCEPVAPVAPFVPAYPTGEITDDVQLNDVVGVYLVS